MIDSDKCAHPQHHIRMNGICMDCETQVRPYDCDCGICNFCNGLDAKILDAEILEESE